MENMEIKTASQAPQKAKTRSIFTGLILSLILLVILNLISSFFFYRLDFSKGKIHTLSKTSKTLVSKLNDNVVVKVYLSSNLPPDYSVLARYAKDILAEYKQYGKNRFRYEIIGTNNEDAFRGDATRNNVFAQRVMILENDQQTVRDIFMGLSFEYKGNRETLNLTKDIEGRMEYEITAILRRLTKATLPKISVFQDSLYSAEYYKYFEHYANQNYQIIPTDLNRPEKESEVLIMPGVVDSLTAIQLFNFDQYIMHGGKVLILQDRISGLVQYNQAQEIKSNLFKFLEQYGIDIKPNLVLDQACAPINMSQRSGIYVVDVPMPYPPIPMVQGMKSSVIGRGLSDMLLYFCSEINIHPQVKDITVTPLLQTSPNSGIMTGPDFDINPEKYMGQKLMPTLILPPITVAALYTGTFTSYFAKMPNVAATQGFVAKSDKSEIIVISDSDFIRDFIVSSAGSNMMFFLNAVDYLLKDVSMSEVRSRTIPNSPLEINQWLYKMKVNPERIIQIEPTIRQIVKGINLIVPSSLLILLGLYRFFRLKKSRKSLQLRFRVNKPVLKEQEQTEEEIPE